MVFCWMHDGQDGGVQATSPDTVLASASRPASEVRTQHFFSFDSSPNDQNLHPSSFAQVVAHSAAEAHLNLSEDWHFCWKQPFVFCTAVRSVKSAYLPAPRRIVSDH